MPGPDAGGDTPGHVGSMAGRMSGEPRGRVNALRELTARRGGLLPAALERAGSGTPEVPESWAPRAAEAAGLPAAAGLGPATFFADHGGTAAADRHGGHS